MSTKEAHARGRLRVGLPGLHGRDGPAACGGLIQLLPDSDFRIVRAAARTQNSIIGCIASAALSEVEGVDIEIPTWRHMDEFVREVAATLEARWAAEADDEDCPF